jgi:hypothetical protein
MKSVLRKLLIRAIRPMVNEMTCNLMSRQKGWMGIRCREWRDGCRVARGLVWSISVIICLAAGSCAGTVAVRNSAADSSVMQASARRTVVLSPAVEAGWAGWCVSIEGVELSGSCASVRSHGLILAERWGRGVRGGVVDVGVTSSNVASVLLSNGAVMPTRAEPGLPAGLRVIVAEIADGGTMPLGAIISHGLTPLNAKREQIARANDRVGSLGYEVQSEGRNVPSHGICAIGTTGTGAIRTIRGGEVSDKQSYPGLIGEAFVTCASTEYSFDRGTVSLLGGMLVDASRVGTTPGPLPRMKILDGHDGIYEAPAETGEILAKRLAGAWLFVASGPFTKASVDLAQRLSLLEHLRAKVNV